MEVRAEIAQRGWRANPQRVATERFRDGRRRDAGGRAIEVESCEHRRSVTVITQEGVQEPRTSRGNSGWVTDWLTRYRSERGCH